MARAHTCEGCGVKLVSFWATLCQSCNDIFIVAREMIESDPEDYDA